MVFSTAMAFLESAVVIYLRELFYPGGFEFPLRTMSDGVALVEILREVATLIMLTGLAILTYKSASERFAGFLIAFAIWDIGYYVFLKLFLDWPLSLFDWDILFLIPSIWTGPVLAPLILSILMIALGMSILVLNNRYRAPLMKIDIFLLLTGSLLAIAAFTFDFFLYLLQSGGTSGLNSERSAELISGYSPGRFPWFIFILACLVILAGIIRYITHYVIPEKNLSKYQMF